MGFNQKWFTIRELNDTVRKLLWSIVAMGLFGWLLGSLAGYIAGIPSIYVMIFGMAIGFVAQLLVMLVVGCLIARSERPPR